MVIFGRRKLSDVLFELSHKYRDEFGSDCLFLFYIYKYMLYTCWGLGKKRRAARSCRAEQTTGVVDRARRFILHIVNLLQLSFKDLKLIICGGIINGRTRRRRCTKTLI